MWVAAIVRTASPDCNLRLLLQPHALSRGRKQVFSYDAKLKEGKQGPLYKRKMLVMKQII